MKTYNVILLILVFFSFGFLSITKTKVKILPKSQITICGKSNVNSFQCKYNSNFLENEILVTSIKNGDNKISINNAKIAIKCIGFDCGNRMITNDLKATLKADVYEKINIELKELDLKNNSFLAIINIEIAGKNKEFEIPVTFNENTNNVKGNLKLNIKDFDLKSRKKLFGFIEVNDNVEINLNLFLQY